MKEQEYIAERFEMVESQIALRGVRDRHVLNAMKSVPREAFLKQSMRHFAYDDMPQPIAAGQTISQPYMVAFMIEALGIRPGETVLEVGTGSGYAAAVLGEIANEVYTIERIEELAKQAKETLRSLGYRNVHVLCGDGTKGCLAHAPFDGIVVAASGPRVPDSLKSQLRVGGRMVMPVGKTSSCQQLVRITRESKDKFKHEKIADVRFVPLIGEKGWKIKEPRKK